MPTHINIPTVHEMEQLAAWRGPGAVSIYLPTEPDGHNSEGERIELANLASDAIGQLKDAGLSRADASSIEESLGDLIDDEDFWRFQAHTLAIFVNESGIVTHRLPNQLSRAVEVSDRFAIKPLLRTFTFPQTAFILAISQGAVRLIEASPDLPPGRIEVSDLPSDVASAVGQPSIRGRSYDGRIGGSEGQKLRMRQYARKIDQALALVLGGHDLPLVLAGTDPLVPIYRSVNSYPHLVQDVISGNPDDKSDAELVADVRPVLDRIYANELAELQELFGTRRAQGRAVTDLADVARASTFGAVDTLLVDIDQVIPGEVDEETGKITPEPHADAHTYGITDEITRRVLMSSGRVLAVRADEVPEGGPVAALLRFPLG